VSFGGSSPAAYAAGGAEADIYCLWGEPLADTAEQIAWVKEAAARAGRAEPPKFQVAFRPILGATEHQAWDKAHGIVEAIAQRKRAGGGPLGRRPGGRPQNTGSQRLVDLAARGERYDRALWTATAAATGGAGNSNALVGTPETVAAALLDYYDLGIEILSARGYDTLPDAIEFGEQVIPIVREEVAKRDRHRGVLATAS
jgi:alkanesulfonate monooxygenase